MTGAASGIGKAVAERLAVAGAAVTVLDLDGDAAQQVAGSIGGEALQADLSDYGVVDSLEFEADIVVNNAGIQHVAAIEEFPPERFSTMMRIMLEAPFRIVRKALPGMYEKGWGRVINISSVHGLRASPYKAAYISAKHGLEGLSKVIALEGGPKGVTSNCICPAYVRTPLVEGQIADQARTRGISEREVIEKVMLTGPAIKRLIEPEEVAELAAFLCTEQASFVTGASLTMDGAATAQW
ncbi:MAG: D-beta-hydroxybutyrate dehydrogenase [uncultured Rubrobacteraceae bacterium]|uniref:D-beta-hydroxybutyrate dehydrogenase n=1 Tax=uncultured Rubrobacteraceae bacterium TaxID=349277 RepID=A0A6J4RYX2_9ACTN|nr:MAG: D-beta-hydroxybutyrate dehydrogenase [uncultured Rubrobacteraceae bacterium]